MSETGPDGLPILAFDSATALRAWLLEHHAKSSGIWLRIAKGYAGRRSVTFEEVLDEGLCFGWSESKRINGDDESYLQRFTPRRTKGTTSKRNLQRVAQLLNEDKMMPAGLAALGM